MSCKGLRPRTHITASPPNAANAARAASQLAQLAAARALSHRPPGRALSFLPPPTTVRTAMKIVYFYLPGCRKFPSLGHTTTLSPSPPSPHPASTAGAAKWQGSHGGKRGQGSGPKEPCACSRLMCRRLQGLPGVGHRGRRRGSIQGGGPRIVAAKPVAEGAVRAAAASAAAAVRMR